MGRLIDADELLQEFETENVAHNSDLWHITGIKAFIEAQPTAYDPKQVVKDIEAYSRSVYGEIYPVRVISIVRNGGMKK